VDADRVTDLQAASLEDSTVELDKMLKDLLKQNFDRETLLETFYRMTRLIMVSKLSFGEKFKRIQALYKDIHDGRKGISTSFSKLSLENSCARSKNWYLPHALLGVGTGAGAAGGVWTGPDVDAAQVSEQASAAVAGDLVSATSNLKFFNAAHGNTKSYQAAMLLIKNMLIALAVIHKDELNENEKIETELKAILNVKTGRVNAWFQWDFIKGTTTSFDTYAWLDLASRPVAVA
jgi:hypothetical protein